MNKQNEMRQIVLNAKSANEIIINAQSATYHELFTPCAIDTMKIKFANIMLDDDVEYSQQERAQDALQQVREYARAMLLQ